MPSRAIGVSTSWVPLSGKKSMLHKTFTRTVISSICLILFIGFGLPPFRVAAQSLANSPSALPELPTFDQSVENGRSHELRGVYVEGIFELKVVQQPVNNPDYVTPLDNTITQFGPASQLGNVGLLAHDTLSGSLFSMLAPGQVVRLIYGDGRLDSFLIVHIYRYQAISPLSPTSDFQNLDENEYLTASQLFMRMYGGPRHLTFQTCTVVNGNPAGGRVFVVAEPLQTQPSN